MSLVKYRLKEVATDFGVAPKVIADIISKYFQKPKSNTQVLTDEELNLVFDHMTQTHQIASLEQVFAVKPAPKAEPPKPEAPKAEAPKQEAQQAAKPQQAKPQSQPQNQNRPQQPQQNAQAQSNNNPQSAQQQPMRKPKEPERKRERRVVDTSAVQVNAGRFADVDNLVSERVQNYQGGKQRIGGKKGQQGNKQQNGKFRGSKSRNEEQEKMRRLQLEIAKKAQLVVKIPDEISVGELASRMKKTGAEVVKCLMKNGVMASLSQMIDFDTASFVAEELGCKVEKEVVVTIEEKLIDDHEDTADELKPRAPVVVVMGHVDHGKTSLLDYIRNAHVASGEAGGITQHIGAYTVEINGQPITFLDTPGHAAFTEMRARGAMCTDIAILVVAADDGIMPQTIEAINHAKAAQIPIIVAVNKMDKHGANPDRILTQLTEHGLTPSEWGGETEVCKISAKTGAGIDELLETVILTAEMEELKANPNRAGKGCVLEARLDKNRGPIATLLVQNGTLRQSDLIIAGTAVGRVRVMTNDKGAQVKEAGPSVPVEITGLADVPEAGDEFEAVVDERMARELADRRRTKAKEEAFKANARANLNTLFDQLSSGVKDLNIIVKADVDGTVEAVRASLQKLTNEEVRVCVIHAACGGITEGDVTLAAASNAIIVGFNVRPDRQALDSAERQGVEIRTYRVIYECIEEIEAAMKGMLAPKFREKLLGHAEVRQTIRVPSVGTIAGCYITDGKIARSAQIRIVRDGVVIQEDKIASLRRFKDDVKEVAEVYECGVGLERFNDIKEGDVLEAFVMEEIKD